MKNIFHLIAIFLFFQKMATAQTDISLLVEKTIRHDTIIYDKEGDISRKIEIKKEVVYEWNYYKSGLLFNFKIKKGRMQYAYSYDCTGLLYSSEYIKNGTSVTTIYSVSGIPLYIYSVHSGKVTTYFMDSKYSEESIEHPRFECLPKSRLPAFKD